MKPLALACATVLAAVSVQTLAQTAYVFTYNPGPRQGTKWMAKASDGNTEAATSVVLSAPRPVWARVCYTIGPSDSSVAVYAQTRNQPAHSSDVAWGGCVDVFGSSIWIGNPHEQVVGGYYGIAPATPND